MRRRGRHLFTFCSAVSLLLCVGAAGLWVRGYGTGDRVDCNLPGGTADHLRAVSLTSGRGGVSMDIISRRVTGGDASLLHLPAAASTATWTTYRIPDRVDEEFAPCLFRATFAGFGAATWTASTTSEWDNVGGREVLRGSLSGRLPWVRDTLFVRTAWAPMWSVVLVTAAFPALWLWRTLRTRRRLARGLCAACGYDLRASPARCPECGT